MEADGSCSKCVRYDKLKELSAQVVIKYDNLFKKYQENVEHFNKVKDLLLEREREISDMKKLIEPAIQEHVKVKTQLKIEQTCRHGAEEFARMINSKNIEIKRQSNMLMAQMNKADRSFNLEDFASHADNDKDDITYKKYTDDLNKTIKDLENQVASLTAQLQQTIMDRDIQRQKYEDASEKHHSTSKRLKEVHSTLLQYQEAMFELSKVSEEAFTEYENLKQKYEQEQKVAFEFHKENVAMKKQSTLILQEIMPDQKLFGAVQEVERLTLELQEHKQQSCIEIGKLKNQLEESGTKVVGDDEERVKLTTERDELLQKLDTYEKRYIQLEKEYKTIEKKLEEANQPPPPPPPPPPPAIIKSKGFLSKIKGNKKDAKKKAMLASVGGNEDYSKALKEMMDRIQSGRSLNKVLRPTGRRGSLDELENDNSDEQTSTPPEPSKDQTFSTESESIENTASFVPLRKNLSRKPVNKLMLSESSGEPEKKDPMSELNSILNRFKRSQSESDLTAPIETMEANSEYASVFKRVKGQQTKDDPEPVMKLSHGRKLSAVCEEEK